MMTEQVQPCPSCRQNEFWTATYPGMITRKLDLDGGFGDVVETEAEEGAFQYVGYECACGYRTDKDPMEGDFDDED